MSMARRRFMTTVIWDALPFAIIFGYLACIAAIAYMVWKLVERFAQ